MARADDRPTYLELIDQDRASHGDDPAAAPAATPGQPPHARKGYGRKRQLDKALARNYERCKDDNRGRFKSGKRLDSYCAAVSWTIARKSGAYPDYPTFRRPAPKPKPQPKTKESAVMSMPGRRADGTFKPGHRSTSRKRSTSHRPRSTRKAAAPRRAAPVRAAEPRRAAPRRASSPSRARARSSARPRSSSRPRSSQRAPAVNLAIVQPNARETRHRTTSRGRTTHRRGYRRASEWKIAQGFGGGTLVSFGVGGIIGAVAADMAGRYFTGVSTATGATAPTYPTAQTGATAITTPQQWNDLAYAARPSWLSVGVQFGVAALGFVIGYFVKPGILKGMFYGFGTGALVTLSVRLLNAYVLEPLFSGTDAGGRMYQHEWNADGSFGAGTMSGPPGGQRTMGAPPASAALPAGRPGARIPSALAVMRAMAPAAGGNIASPPGGGNNLVTQYGPPAVATGVQPGAAAPPANTTTAAPPANVLTAVPPAAVATGVQPGAAATTPQGGNTATDGSCCAGGCGSKPLAQQCNVCQHKARMGEPPQHTAPVTYVDQFWARRMRAGARAA